jgi:hypothetical protein
MTMLENLIGKVSGRRQPAAAAAAPAREPQSAAPAELVRKRDTLAREVAELYWDLGGLTYEMARRDHFRLDVLVRRAAELQERDAELAEVERLLRLDGAAATGACPSCGALHSRGATFCWSCGSRLIEDGAPTEEATTHEAASGNGRVAHDIESPDDQPTGEIDPSAT